MDTQMAYSLSHISYGKDKKTMKSKIFFLSANEWIHGIHSSTRRPKSQNASVEKTDNK